MHMKLKAQARILGKNAYEIEGPKLGYRVKMNMKLNAQARIPCKNAYEIEGPS